MENDIVPALLQKIESEFDQKTYNSQKIKKAVQLLSEKKASFLDANEFAIEVGEILADVLGSNITAEILPDGKMYFNIADRVLNPTLKKNHELIASFAIDVQEELNELAGLKIKGQKPELNQERIDGLINKVSDAEQFEDVKWVLDEPIINFSQSIVDDTVQENIEFQAKSGLIPKIIRRVSGHNPCDWCRNLAGTYDYFDAPDDIYRRHSYCRCTVDYDPGDGRRQDVWSKQWQDPDRAEKLDARKQIGIDVEKNKAKELLRVARQEERAVTNDLVSISHNVGSEMAGLDFRIKTLESLTRKIVREPEAKMRDILRYTNIADEDTQVNAYFKTLEQLDEKGYNVSAVKNYWLNPENPYNGININLLTPSGYEFELQFHTQDSFNLKNGKLHELYEQQRLLDPFKNADEILQLDIEMANLSNNLNRPKDIDLIGGGE